MRLTYSDGPAAVLTCTQVLGFTGSNLDGSTRTECPIGPRGIASTTSVQLGNFCFVCCGVLLLCIGCYRVSAGLFDHAFSDGVQGSSFQQ